MNTRMLGMVIGSFLLVGCFSPMQKRQFIPIGSPIEASVKQAPDVQLFAKTSEIPWAYIQIGRITPEGDRYNHQSASDQIFARWQPPMGRMV
jgi:hypothetical protein